MIEQVFYFKLINDLMNVVVIFTQYFSIKKTTFTETLVMDGDTL